MGSLRSMTEDGYCVATPSGPEKSRHIRHDASCCTAPLAWTASICAALGRDARGTGGGAAAAASAGVPIAVFPETSGTVRTNLAGGGGSRRVGRLGTGRSATGALLDCPGRLGSRGGSEGRLSGGPPRVGNVGIDRVGSNCALTILEAMAALEFSFSWACAASRSFLEGGRGGRVASSRGGGSLLLSEGIVLVRDSEDMVDLTDSFELRRTAKDCVEALRGGKAGDGLSWSESLRGNCGGPAPRSGCETVLVLCGRTGGAFLAGRAGRDGDGA